MAQAHDGHRERLRERYISGGFDAFQPHEILELLLTWAVPRRDVNPIAHDLIRHFGSLSAVFDAEREDLEAIDGIGPNAALFLSMMGPLCRQYQLSRLSAKKVTLRDPDAVKEYCVALMRDVRDEEFTVLAFDRQLRLIGTDKLAEGVPDQVAVFPRKVVEALIRRGATSAVICHNHPGGSAKPSREDIALTNELKKALETVSIRLNDHILVAGGEGSSFHELGLI
ncbi:MAG: DNA repair protein RadC [Clostridia bacterium]|nr:DNA repair protein RadC [Clostridia bacterium]